MRKLITAILLTLALVTPANAGNSGQLTLGTPTRYFATPVDNATWCGDCINTDYTTGSPWTVNPTQCMWDQDDWFEYSTDGNIFGPGASLSFTECQLYTAPVRYGWSGGDLNYIVFYSPSPDLQITYKWTWDAGSKSFTLPRPVRESYGQYKYQICLWAPPPTGGTKVSIPGSHDGVAIYQYETVTITNPTNKKLGKTGGLIGSDYRDNSLWCPNGWIEV